MGDEIAVGEAAIQHRHQSRYIPGSSHPIAGLNVYTTHANPLIIHPQRQPLRDEARQTSSTRRHP